MRRSGCFSSSSSCLRRISLQRIIRISESFVVCPRTRHCSSRTTTRSTSSVSRSWPGREGAEEGREEERRRSLGIRNTHKSSSFIRNTHNSSAMSNSSETTAIAQAEAAGREAAKAGAVAEKKPSSGAEEANGDGGGALGDKKSSSQQQNGSSGEKSDGLAVEEDDSTVGFARPEMHSEALVGTVQYFERHLFLCCKGPESWPKIVEAASEEFDRLPNRLAAALKARKNDMPLKTRLTICEESPGPDSSSAAGDVLSFPDMVRYKGLTDTDVDEFVEDALVGGKEWKKSGAESLSGSYVFVCSHGSRDKRCGSCGPVLIETLKEEIRVRGLEEQIFVRACSHIGGHKYAGNVIVFSSSGTGAAVTGHWYGYVSPADVPLILDQHIGRGEIIERLWRGQMGVTEGDQKLAQQSRLGSGAGDAGNSCCQSIGPEKVNGVNQCGGGSGCCQTLSERVVKEVKENRIPDYLVTSGSSSFDGHLIFPEDEDTDEEPADPRIRLWGDYYIPLPKWIQTWEKEDSNAALAVIGAGAAVAVAIHLWRETSSSSS